MTVKRLAPSKKWLFYGIALSPWVALFATLAYFVWFTNIVQQVYTESITTIYFECIDFVDAGYVYKAKPGACIFNNLEYQTVLNHNEEGFRNPPPKAEVNPKVDVVLLGDSYTHGYGVNDEDTFARQLNKYGYTTKNLGMASYATQTELKALARYTAGEKVVVIQYCDNDAFENQESLRLDASEFATKKRTLWQASAQSYLSQKEFGLMVPIRNLKNRLLNGNWQSMRAYNRRQIEIRGIEGEADTFAQILARYEPLLKGKRVIVFEASGRNNNHPAFQSAFSKAIHAHLPHLDLTVLDSSQFLRPQDYYFFDDHLNARGHAAVAKEIALALGSTLAKQAQ